MMRLRKRWEKIINELNISTDGRKKILLFQLLPWDQPHVKFCKTSGSVARLLILEGQTFLFPQAESRVSYYREIYLLSAKMLFTVDSKIPRLMWCLFHEKFKNHMLHSSKMTSRYGYSRPHCLRIHEACLFITCSCLNH